MQNKTIREIKALLNDETATEETLAVLEKDERKGVKQLVKSYRRKINERKLQEEAFQQKVAFDERYKRVRTDLVAGVDETGRGPLAGPVVAAAVILPEHFSHDDLNDSKQLTEAKRNELYYVIKEEALAYSIRAVDAKTIDTLNILEATRKAMEEAITSLQVAPDFVLIDAVSLHNSTIPHEAIVKGDAKSLAISAASILAKVTRDRMMVELHEQFPMYGFNRHMGYGTKEHLLALEKYGITEHHRTSFAPVQKYL